MHAECALQLVDYWHTDLGALALDLDDHCGAIQAAADTSWPPGVRALGKALAAGLVQADDATIDIPTMILPAMTQMVASHLQLLDLMVMCRWDNSVAGRGAQRIDAPDTAHLAHIKSE